MRAALAAAVAFLVAPAPAAAAAQTVTMPGRHFDPARLTVVAGDTVVWRNDDAEQHTVAAAGGAFASPILPTHGQFAHRFDTPGSYAYVCTLHPFMRGWIEVLAALTGPAPATPGAPQPTAVALDATRRGRGIELTARVTPPRPGAVLALQLHFRDRFAWRQVAHRRLRAGKARFRLRGDVRRRARLVLYDRAGAVIATSRVLRPWTIRGSDADGELMRAHRPE